MPWQQRPQPLPNFPDDDVPVVRKVNALIGNGLLITGKLFVRWPAAMLVLRDTFSPPTDVAARIPYDGQPSHRWTEPNRLAGGTYYYELQEQSDGGVAGTAIASQTVVVPTPPVAPKAMAYVSGTAGAGMVFSFLNSQTAGATYNAYLGLEDFKQINLLVPDATAAAGTPGVANTITIPNTAFVGWTAGKRAFILIRATSGGIEDGNTAFLIFQLGSGGAPQSNAPNTPALIAAQAVFVGRQIQIRGTYPFVDEKGIAVSLQLFDRGPNGTYNLAAPLVTSNLAVTSMNIKSANFAYTYGSDIGQRWFAIAAVTSDGVQGPLSLEIGPFDVTSVDPLPAVTDFKIDVARG